MKKAAYPNADQSKTDMQPTDQHKGGHADYSTASPG